jgi:hypothetical protein
MPTYGLSPKKKSKKKRKVNCNRISLPGKKKNFENAYLTPIN